MKHKITNLISKVSMTAILFTMFIHTSILGSNSAPSYAQSQSLCNCVIFAMDDIADYGYNKVQLATMDYFISKELPFTASIIVSQFASNSNSDVFRKVQEGLDMNLFEIAIHGYRHVNHTLLTKEEQVDDFSAANAKLEYLFSKRANIFIPPFNDFNLHTIEAMADLNISLFSTSPDSEQTTTNPYKSQTLAVANNSRLEVSKVSDEKPLVYHAPFSVSFLRLEGNGFSGEELVEESLNLIDESIEKHGFAQVRLHPSDFPQVNATTGRPINEVDIARFHHLTQLVDSLEERNIRIASFSDIYAPHSADLS